MDSLASTSSLTSRPRFSLKQTKRAQLGQIKVRCAVEPAGEKEKKREHVAVVGGGWGGWGAAKALCEAGCKVTLLDAIPDPTGATPYLTPTGKPFEAGTRGFWKDYPNIEQLVSELGLREEDVFTEFTPSSFFSPEGLEATAPVFSGSEFPQLPSPLGQVFATFENFKRLPLSDRASMAGLLVAMIDFTSDPETFEAYDRMTAHELFIRFGLSKRLVEDFVRPTLLVGLFKPPEELSAAVAMELLYYYALAHQTSFDVRWIKNKSIAETIISPLATQLTSQYDLTVRGGCRVSELGLDDGDLISTVKFQDFNNGGKEETLEELDGCVLALGSKGMKAVMGSSGRLAKVAPELAAASSLGGIDVVAVRIWLDKFVPTDTPANVFSKFPALRGAGGTFFMLDQLQPDHDALWGGEEPQGSVLACDFYNAGAILPLTDEDIVDMLMNELLPEAVPEFKTAKPVDSFVARYPGAVSWFSPGSFKSRPPLETSVHNLVCAGDWVRMGDKEHGAKGLCQERAYVSGIQAANSLTEKGIVGGTVGEHPVIPIRDDEPQVVVGREANKLVKNMILNPLGLKPDWLR